MARRNRKIDLRLNDTEFERLNNDVQKTGLSREEYLRSLITHSPIKDMKLFAEEAKKYGVLYAAVVNKKQPDGLVDVVVNAADVSNSIVQERYITVSVAAKDIEEARSYFNRVGADLTAHLAQLSSSCEELNSVERFRICHDFFRQGEEVYFCLLYTSPSPRDS